MKNILSIISLLISTTACFGQAYLHSDTGQGMGLQNPAAVGLDGKSFARVSYLNQEVLSATLSDIKAQYENGVNLGKGIMGFSVGISNYHENLLTRSSANVACNYQMQIVDSKKGKHHISLGGGLNFSQSNLERSFSTTQSIRIGSVSTIGNFKGPISTNWDEFNPSYQVGVDLGLLYTYKTKKDQSVKAGFSIRNLNQPSFSIGNASLFRFLTIYHASLLGNISLTNKLFVQPQAQYLSVNGEYLYILANNFSYKIGSGGIEVIAGAGLRKFSNVQLNLGASYKGFKTVISYVNQADIRWGSGQMIEINTSYHI